MTLSAPLLGTDSTAKYAFWQKWVFLLTFVNYAMSHISRKCYTNVKMDLVASGVDKIILSQMDMAFMFTYAIGSFVSGRLGDMFPQNVIIGVGLLGSTLCLGRPAGKKLADSIDAIIDPTPPGSELLIANMSTNANIDMYVPPVTGMLMQGFGLDIGRKARVGAIAAPAAERERLRRETYVTGARRSSAESTPLMHSSNRPRSYTGLSEPA